MKRRTNVRMEGFEVHDCGCLEYWRVEYSRLEGGCKLLVSEHQDFTDVATVFF